MISEDTDNATSLQELEDGRLRSNGQDGAIDQPGREVVPVSRFRAQESEKALPTNATSGPLFNLSSPSATLQWSLESRLRQRMEGNGSPLYALTWSNWDMPAGTADLSAAGIGAPHIRQRLFWVANANGRGLQEHGQREKQPFNTAMELRQDGQRRHRATTRTARRTWRMYQ